MGSDLKINKKSRPNAENTKVKGMETKTRKQEVKKCHFCATTHAMDKLQCPAYGKRCKACGGRNHFEKVCKKHDQDVKSVEHENDSDYNDSDTSTEYINLVQPVHTDEKSGQEVDSDTQPINKVTGKRTEHKPGFRKDDIFAKILLKPSGKAINFQIDSGAKVNTIPAKLIPEDRKGCIEDKPFTLRMWNGATIKALGTITLKIQNPKNNKKYSVLFTVVDADLTPY